jgi:hypothetical protein
MVFSQYKISFMRVSSVLMLSSVLCGCNLAQEQKVLVENSKDSYELDKKGDEVELKLEQEFGALKHAERSTCYSIVVACRERVSKTHLDEFSKINVCNNSTPSLMNSIVCEPIIRPTVLSLINKQQKSLNECMRKKDECLEKIQKQ